MHLLREFLSEELKQLAIYNLDLDLQPPRETLKDFAKGRFGCLNFEIMFNIEKSLD